MRSFEVNVRTALTEQCKVPCISFDGPWLAKAGFRRGGKATVNVEPGLLVIIPKAEEAASPRWAQSFLGTIGEALDTIRESVVMLHSQPPEPSREMLDDRTPTLVGPELKALLGRLIEDDLDPALDKLIRAAEVTDAELLEEWHQRRFAFPACFPFTPADPAGPAVN